jgi:hypothetical protein
VYLNQNRVMSKEQLHRIYSELMATSIGRQVYGWYGGGAVRAIITEVVCSVETIQCEERMALVDRPPSVGSN